MTETQATYDVHADRFADKVNADLKKPLSPALPKTLKGMRYLEGHTVISQANRIFGFDGWGYDVVSVQLHEIDTKDKKGNPTKAYGYSATVTVTVNGAPPRTDVGFNTVAEWRSGYHPDAHDTAMKGAVTDAMKRALRSFGHQFGNGLYGDGTYDQKMENEQAAPPQNGQRAPQSNARGSSAKPTQNGAQAAPPPPANGDDAQFMDDKPLKSVIEQINELGADHYGKEEWWAGVNAEVAKWVSTGNVDNIANLTAAEADRVLNSLKKKGAGE